jgi:hypothetical protein
MIRKKQVVARREIAASGEQIAKPACSQVGFIYRFLQVQGAKMSSKFSRTMRFVNKLFYLGSAAMMMAAIALSVTTGTVAATGNSGAIWTTDSACGTASQDVNIFHVGDHVYINFSGFPAGTYAWTIQQISGNPKPIVASGTRVIDSSGAGCFDAHTILSSEVGNEYTVDLGTKNDNYLVRSSATPTATGTHVPTATSTILPTSTNTAVPTATNTVQPTATSTLEPTATNTSEPTATGTLEPTNTSEPTKTSEPTSTAEPTSTSEPTATEVSEPTATSTRIPESTQVSEPTSTPFTEVTPTTPSRKITTLLLDVGIDPFCTYEGTMQWTVVNSNASNVIMNRFTVDGVNYPGFVVTPGEHDLVTTPLGTHTVKVYYNEASVADLTSTINVCPLLIPVTGNPMIIPVTGADQSNSLGMGLGLGSFSLAGIGLVLSSLRRIFKM